MALKQLFFQKKKIIIITKKLLSRCIRALTPDYQNLRRLGLRPRPLSVMRLSYTSLPHHASQFRHLKKSILTFGVSPTPFSKILVTRLSQAPASDLPFYGIFVPQGPSFQKFMMMSLQAI